MVIVSWSGNYQSTAVLASLKSCHGYSSSKTQWENVSELQHSDHFALCFVSQQRLRRDFWIIYYTSNISISQQVFCNLPVIFQLTTSGIRSLCLTLDEPMLAWVFGLPLFLSGHQVVFVFSFHRWILHQLWIYDNNPFQ